MLKLIRVAALLLALFAAPAIAQTPGPTAVPAHPTVPGRPTVPPATPPTASKPASISSAPSPSQAAGKVDINAGTEAQLDTLPGVGPARAKAIISNRPYADLQDLVTKKVLTSAIFDGAKSRMALANINTASAADLAKTLPGIGEARSKAIVAGRPYATPQDLVTKGILPQGVFDGVKELVTS